MARLAMLALASCGLLLRATPEPTAPACSYARITHSDDKTSAVTRCAAPAISSESASEAASWIGCSAAAANGVHGPCRWYDASRLAPRAVWMSRWLAAPNRLHSKSSLCTDALLYRCTARSDGLSAHRSHPAFGARHLVSVCV